MQIIIVQTEIETAIRNHILTQLSVREGMRIDIDLSATRGPEGFKATIDIVADDSQPAASQQEETLQQAEPAAQAQPAVAPARATSGIRKATPIAKASKDPVQEAPQSSTDNIPEGEAQNEGSIAEQAAEAAPATTTTARSLFGNVDPIKND